MVEERRIGKSVIDIICKEYEKGETTIDICKLAVLKYYSTRDYNSQTRKTLKKFLQELCGKQIYFPFFLAYEKDWLIELQLWDKSPDRIQGAERQQGHALLSAPERAERAGGLFTEGAHAHV